VQIGKYAIDELFAAFALDEENTAQRARVVDERKRCLSHVRR
jgi:hypothetical protein